MLPPPRRFKTACRADVITGGTNLSGDLLLPHLGGKGSRRGQQHGDHAVTD